MLPPDATNRRVSRGARSLRSPTQTRNVRQYLLNNARKHFGERGADPFASRVALREPRTYLLISVERRSTA